MKLVNQLLFSVAIVLPAQMFAREAVLQPLPAELPALKLLNTVDKQATPEARLLLIDRVLTLLVQPTSFRGQILCERAITLDSLNRPEDALVGFRQCLQLIPNDSNALYNLGLAEVSSQNPKEGVERIIQAIGLDPDVAKYIDAEDFSSFQRKLAYAGAMQLSDRLTETLVKAGWSRENPAAYSEVVAEAIRHRLAANDKAGALELLPSVITPRSGVGMLIDRRYSGIWTEIERWGGTDLSVQRRALIDGATNTYRTAQSPTSRIAYINALYNTGRSTEAIAELEHWSRESSLNQDPFYKMQVITSLGRLLGESGQRMEGISLMKTALNDSDPEGSVAHNIVPNLVRQMLMQKDFKGSAVLLDRFFPKENQVEAPAALGYYVALKACAAGGLGNAVAAREGYDRVRSVYTLNINAVEIVTNCLGSPNDNAELWIKSVNNPSTRNSALVSLERARYAASLHLPPKTSAEAGLRVIQDRSDVRAEFNKFGRRLPERYKAALIDYAALPAEPVSHNVEGPRA